MVRLSVNQMSDCQIFGFEKSGNPKPGNLAISNSGFTLSEVLISILIVGILFVGGYTAYRDFARRQTLNAAVEDLKANLVTARSRAISAERPTDGSCTTYLGYVVIFSGSSYIVRPECDPTDPGPLSPHYNSYTLHSSLTATVAETPTVNQILFKPLGGGTDITNQNGGMITLTSSVTSNFRTVTVYPSGAVK